MVVLAGAGCSTLFPLKETVSLVNGFRAKLKLPLGCILVGNVVLLFVLFAVLLFMISLKTKSIVKIIVAVIPIGSILLCNSWGSQRFIYYFERSIGMPELLPLEIFPLAFILSIFILISIFYKYWHSSNVIC